MVFSSIPFLFYFLPLVLAVYFLTPRAAKNLVLLIFSLIFIGWGGLSSLILIIVSIVQGYIFGLLADRYRGSTASGIFMWISVVMSMGILCVFKYADFFITNINAVSGLDIKALKLILPVGISFFTFQIISYVADVYRGECKAQKNIINLALYISMFPQLIAGPIVKYTDVEKQLSDRRTDMGMISDGICVFASGLGKKVIIANQLGELVADFGVSSDISVLYYWMYAVAFTLQMYFDFSGYSDMAVGLGRIFGFELCRNFNYPYISSSITEFWRRWHISLGTWFREYLYIPLGGNRVSKGRWLLNIMIVWMATGLWHGAEWNFVIWGMYFALILVTEKLFLKKYLKKHRVLRHVYVMFFVVIGCVIFNAGNMTQVITDISAMFGFTDIPLISAEAVYYLESYAVLLVIAAAGCTPLAVSVIKMIDNNEKLSGLMTVLQPVYVMLMLAVSTAYLVDGSFNPFLYFRF